MVGSLAVDRFLPHAAPAPCAGQAPGAAGERDGGAGAERGAHGNLSAGSVARIGGGAGGVDRVMRDVRGGRRRGVDSSGNGYPIPPATSGCA